MVLLLLLGLQSAVYAVEVSVGSAKGKIGETVAVPIVVDEVKNLAGIKLVLKYDPEKLAFKEGVNTKHSASLMHIVNDKTPGRLILVMAGAKGIGGKDLELMVFKFQVKKGANGNPLIPIDITEFQLMDDQLKEIKGKAKSGAISMTPPASDAP